MSDGSESSAVRNQQRNLAEAIREVKNVGADRSDVVVELRDAERMRLELVAAELKPVFEQVPQGVDIFDFAISSGLQPRLWIDAVSHVAMGRDKRTYRFVRDTRLGRVVLAESTDVKPVADQVTRYVAERMVEREKMLEGAPIPQGTFEWQKPADPSADVRPAAGEARRATDWARIVSGVYLVCSGALLAMLGGLIFALWQRFLP